ncbi:MAG TPA: TA system VapC family ribonuclease toxin [Armatimonadota bacterium]|nr:TA system VapC family ribonuclease toxin [Armatimonadota bacterium]
MTVSLPDVNVLIALAWPNHIHHRRARQWFDTHHQNGWATCPFTQAGFIRISSNPRIVDQAVTPSEACRLLQRIAARGSHTFWPDDLDLVSDPEAPLGLLVGHQQVADAYLLGLAIRHRGRLATFDRGVAALLPSSSSHGSAVEVIPLDTL